VQTARYIGAFKRRSAYRKMNKGNNT